MTQYIIVYIIVAAALIVGGYKFYKAVFAKKEVDESCGNCGCGENSCKTSES
ncbi:MAG: FeoB-associated Cys-rich membrane protein [Flavobacteriales bacterium]